MDIPIRCIDTPPIAGRLNDIDRIPKECERMLEMTLPAIDSFLIVIKLTRYRYVPCVHYNNTKYVFQTIKID
jgi:hypothetical protein